MSTRFHVLRLRAGLPGLIVASVLVACGGEDTPDECGVGELCPCSFAEPCPNPLLEQCVDNFCVAYGDTDAGDTGDAAGDAADTTDVGGDADAPTEVDGEDEVDTDHDVDAEEILDGDAGDVAPDLDTAELDAPDAEDSDPAEVEPDGETDTGPDRSPYHGWIAYTSIATGGLERVNVIAGDRTLGPFVLPGGGGTLWKTDYPSYSADGTVIAYVLADAAVPLPVVRLANAADFTTTDVLAGLFSAIAYPVLSPDGSKIAFRAKTPANDAWNIFVADADGSDHQALTNVTAAEAAARFVGAAAWDPSGTFLYAIQGVPAAGGDIYRLPLDGGDATPVTEGAGTVSLYPQVRPDGTEALIATGGVFQRVDLATGAVTPTSLPDDTGGTCAYYGLSDRLVCTRLQASAGGGDCSELSSDCLLDVVIADLSGATLSNVTMTDAARESTPTASLQPFDELPIPEFP